MAVRLIFIETGSAEKRITLCRWVERFYDEGKRILVLTDSTLAAQHLDQMLWSFSQSSFVPHCMMTSPTKELPIEPVVILTRALYMSGFEVVVADSEVDPELLGQFVIAVHFVITDDPEQRQKSRLLWQAARDRGWSLEHYRCLP